MGRPISNKIRDIIQGYKEARKTYQEAYDLFLQNHSNECPTSRTVYNIYKLIDQTVYSEPLQKGNVESKKEILLIIENQILEIFYEKPTSSLRKVSKQIQQNEQIQISHQSVSSILKENQIYAFKLPSKILLTQEQKKKKKNYQLQNQEKEKKQNTKLTKMNKIVNQKANLKNQQRLNYHQKQNVNMREGSSPVYTRRIQISSIFTNSSTSQNSKSSYETVSNNSMSRTPNQSKSRSRSFTPLKSVKNRKPTPIPRPVKKGPQPCQFWMEGRCNKFEQFERRHYQTSQILYKQNKMENKINKINLEQLNNKKTLVKIEQTILLSEADLIEMTQRDNDSLSKAIKISYQNKKALNKLKNALNKNQKDPYSTNEQKSAKEKEILNDLLHNTQIDNKNQNALNIKLKKERIKQEKSERALISKNKPKITLVKETEEKQIQNQQSDQNQNPEKNQGEIQEIDDNSDDEIDMTEYNQIKQQPKNLVNNFNQSTQQKQDQNPQPNYQSTQINTSQQHNQFQSQNNQTPLTSKAQQYLKVLLNPSQLDQPNEAEGLSTNQIPQTLMSPSYILGKDKQNNDKQKVIQLGIKQLAGQEIQNDMKWSQNIKSSFNQWKQLRYGKNQINIHPSSEEPTKQQPLNSIEQQETIEKSKLKMLYDWNQQIKSIQK